MFIELNNDISLNEHNSILLQTQLNMQNFAKLNKTQLIEKCKTIGIKTKSNMKKDDLVKLLSSNFESLKIKDESQTNNIQPETTLTQTLELIQNVSENPVGEVSQVQLVDSQPNDDQSFSIDSYFKALGIKINIILARPQKQSLTYDILDIEQDKTKKLIVLEEKQKQMKIGDIWQEAIGSYKGFINLGTGHESGLDIKSENRKLIIELKNRTNTDNASSKKANRDKLAKFKKANPEFECIYANINADTETETMNTETRIIEHNGEQIKEMVGMTFLRFIFGDNTERVIEFIKEKKRIHYSQRNI